MNTKSLSGFIEKLENPQNDLNQIRPELIQSILDLFHLIDEKDEFIRRIARLEYDGKVTASAMLHDGPLQDLSAKLQLFKSVMNSLSESEDIKFHSLKFASEISDVINQIRNILKQTITSSIQADNDFVTTIREIVRKRADGTSVNLIFDGNVKSLIETMPITVTDLVIHFSQETMRNARIHGNATEFEIAIMSDGTALILRTSDNGEGFQENISTTMSDIESLADFGSLGLSMLIKMAEPHSGQLFIKPKGSALGGAEIVLSIPYMEKNLII